MLFTEKKPYKKEIIFNDGDELIVEAGLYINPKIGSIYQDYTGKIGPVKLIGFSKMYGEKDPSHLHLFPPHVEEYNKVYVIYKSVENGNYGIISLKKWDEVVNDSIPRQKRFYEIKNHDDED